MALRVENTWLAVCGSRLPVGSSARSRRGAFATARAIATRCCSPPESSAGRCLSRSAEAEEPQELARARPRLRLREPADELRHDHVLERREFRQQVVELVDEADLLATQAGAADIVHGRGRRAVDEDLAAVRLLEQAGDMEEGRLAGAGRRHERNHLAREDRELGVAQDLEETRPLAVAARDLRQIKRRCRRPVHRRVSRSAAPRPDRAGPPARTDRASRAATGRATSRRRPRPRSGRCRRGPATGNRSVGSQSCRLSAQETNSWIDWMFAVKTSPRRKPASVPTTPIDAPVMRKTRMIAPRVAPMVRRMAMSLDLSFTSMIRPEMMLKRRDEHDQRSG